MAEQTTKPQDETSGGPAADARRSGRFSLGLFVTGLLALLVSVWALTGPAHWEFAAMIPIGWIAVAAAIVAGEALVLTPREPR
ncbi:hypothetical protein [Nocardia carnea]|uniref:hypothetical protein n=1 Tax=Nocardia carnea TaxID=37328 RepID=UPI00245514FC|nr:hypothetical protein [Nocardia carnea]